MQFYILCIILNYVSLYTDYLILCKNCESFFIYHINKKLIKKILSIIYYWKNILYKNQNLSDYKNKAKNW
jgi:hypothetical protein